MYLRAENGKNFGFTLVEVLVALLVLSFGVLAALGLQVAASSNVQNASQRLLAVDLADDLLKRIRANFSDEASAAYLSLTPNTGLGGGQIASNPSTDCADNSASSECTPAELAGYDLWTWERRLDGHYQTTGGAATGGLVDPIACLFGPAAGSGGGFYQLVIVWRSATEAENPVFGGGTPTTEESNINSCGNSTDRYGVNNVHRRVMSMTTYISSS